MNCCKQCQGIEEVFNDKNATRELKQYRQKGPSKNTTLLIETLKAQGLQGLTLLDIGGGVGAIQHDLLQHGVSAATDVDASGAYLAAAKEEAACLGLEAKVSYHHGNFVDLAPQLEPADIVTLDKVICCYDDMPALVQASSALAIKYYAVIFPYDAWWTKAPLKIANIFLGLARKSFRIFVHPTAAVEKLVLGNGLHRIFHQRRGFWQIIVYAR